MSYSTIFGRAFYDGSDITFSSLVDTIYVFVQKVPQVDSAEMSVLASVLDAKERERYSRFVHKDQQRTFLFSHVALRFLLASVTKQRPEHLRYATTLHGKPGIMGGYPLHFNLSHSGEMFAIALAGTELGVDIQKDIPSIDIDALRLLCLTEEECRKMDTDRGSRKSRFFALWAMKEAYVKMTGAGLSVPLCAFQCNPVGENGDYIVIEDSASHIRAKGLSFAVHHGLYQAAVAWKGKEDKHVRIYHEALC